MPKHSLRNGLLIAESLVKIEEKPQGTVVRSVGSEYL